MMLSCRGMARKQTPTPAQILLGLRIENVLTLRQVSDMTADHGHRVSASQISRLERDGNRPTAATMGALARAYGRHPAEIWREPNRWVKIT
jgi:transcriptional regulator with XRE-family HTH domain